MNRRVSIAVATLVLAVVACQDGTLSPTSPRSPIPAIIATSCPAHADFVVADESSLLSAIAAAKPGDTIALNGVVDLTVAPAGLPGVFVQKDNLTFTCVAPGAGIRAEPQTVSWLFVLLGRHLRVEHLVLDGTNGVSGAVVAFNGPEDPFLGFAEDIQLVGNQVLCTGSHIEPCVSIRNDAVSLPTVVIAGNAFQTDGDQAPVELDGVSGAAVEDNSISGGLGAQVTSFSATFQSVTGLRFTGNTVDCLNACVFAGGFSPGAVVARNHFLSEGSSTGVQLQDVTDGDSVVDNTVVTTVPSFALQLGGIRVRDGVNVVVIGNTVSGPWANSIGLNDLTGADIERNMLQGAVEAGIGLATGGTSLPIAMSGNLFRANRASAAGIAGITARLSCSNTFVGNELEGNTGNVGVEFDSTTGANTYVGDPTVVVDNGAFDCNGDGVNDPNHVSGTPRRGAVAADAGPQLASRARLGGRLLK